MSTVRRRQPLPQPPPPPLLPLPPPAPPRRPLVSSLADMTHHAFDMVELRRIKWWCQSTHPPLVRPHCGGLHISNLLCRLETSEHCVIVYAGTPQAASAAAAASTAAATTKTAMASRNLSHVVSSVFCKICNRRVSAPECCRSIYIHEKHLVKPCQCFAARFIPNFAEGCIVFLRMTARPCESPLQWTHLTVGASIKVRMKLLYVPLCNTGGCRGHCSRRNLRRGSRD